LKKLKTLVAEVLGIEESIINNDSSPENIESWDSFNALMLVTDLEKNFNLKFTTEEIVSVKNFKDIVDSLKRHKISEDFLN